METIKSGSELCDDFFTALLKDGEIDSSVAQMLHKLHDERKLSKESILEGLEALRGHGEDNGED
jgi:hypothetical protein